MTKSTEKRIVVAQSQPTILLKYLIKCEIHSQELFLREALSEGFYYSGKIHTLVIYHICSKTNPFINTAKEGVEFQASSSPGYRPVTLLRQPVSQWCSRGGLSDPSKLFQFVTCVHTHTCKWTYNPSFKQMSDYATAVSSKHEVRMPMENNPALS